MVNCGMVRCCVCATSISSYSSQVNPDALIHAGGGAFCDIPEMSVT